MAMAAGLHAATASPNARADPASDTDRGTTRQITIRSTQMSHLLHEDLARAHLEQRLAHGARPALPPHAHLEQRLPQAERQRLANYALRLARARRQARRAGRQLDRAQHRLRLL